MDAIERALKILGLEPEATAQEVKHAYRDLVKIWHPDRFPNDLRVQRKAEEKLKEINEAYNIIQRYGRGSKAGFRPQSGQSARPNPAEDHRKADGAQDRSSSPPYEPSVKSEPGSQPRESRSRRFHWGVFAILVALVLAKGLVRVSSNESPKPENRPRPAAAKQSPSIQFTARPNSSLLPLPKATSRPRVTLREGMRKEIGHDEAKVYVDRGNRKAESGQHSAAIDEYDMAVRLNPRNAGAYFGRGVSWGKLGRHSMAIADFDRAIGFNRDNGRAYYNRGAAKLNLGRILEAKQDLMTALKLAKQDGDESLRASIEQIILDYY